MSFRTRIARLSFAALVCAAGACYETPKFLPESLIDRPRVLSIVAEPPEISVGDTVNMSALVVGAESVSIAWRTCGLFSSGMRGNQYGENSGDQGCSERAPVIGTGLNPTLAPADGAAFLSDEDATAAALGAVLPADQVAAIARDVGIALTIDARIDVDGKQLRALKRVLLRMTDKPHHNPPLPRFYFGNRLLIGVGAQSEFRCVPAEDPVDQPLRVTPSQHIELKPVIDDPMASGDESGSAEQAQVEWWIEPYRVVDARGVLSDREERAFYSWFATAGEFDRATTRSPARDNSWDAPDKPGCVRLWLAVRDGHGGESACGFTVSVGASDSADACASADVPNVAVGVGL
ncbi:MAG: hypothetical protein RL701_5758 [Pseudomonadota bacterium]|jgi:hypothetical protein